MNCAVVNPENVTHQIDLRGLGTTDCHQNVIPQIIGHLAHLTKCAVVQYQIVVFGFGGKDTGFIVVDVGPLNAEVLLIKQHHFIADLRVGGQTAHGHLDDGSFVAHCFDIQAQLHGLRCGADAVPGSTDRDDGGVPPAQPWLR